MGSLMTAPSSFVARTRARAAEVNAKLTAIYNALVTGANDVFFETVKLKSVGASGVDTTITGSDAVFCANFAIPTGATYDLATSTARLFCIDLLTVNSASTLHLASGAVARII